ncbi:MAG TPA: MoaD/ThiS family protein [Ktedonobacterales bacterium]|jgi:molybdopterin synthase sulfur carrier subunit
MPSVTVFLPGALRVKVGDQPVLTVNGSTVREVIDSLEQTYPGLRFQLCYESGELRPFVNIFLHRENIRYLQGLDTPVAPGGQLFIFPSVAGG